MSWLPSRRVCSFRSMSAYGSHFRVEEEGGGPQHVTFDCGVAELESSNENDHCSGQGGLVKLVRVGILKDILVLKYINTNIVLMVVSWVAKDTEMQPRLRRDEHGFWLTNLAARPRCTKAPYILPSLASQVQTLNLLIDFNCFGFKRVGGVARHMETEGHVFLTRTGVLCRRQSHARLVRCVKEGR